MQCRELSSALCDDPEGWAREGGREARRRGVCVFRYLIHSVIEQN